MARRFRRIRMGRAMAERRDADGGPFFDPRRYPPRPIRRGDHLWHFDGTRGRFVGWVDEFIGRAVVDVDGVEVVAPLYMWDR